MPADELRTGDGPVLIVSSRAGLGNFRVAEELARRIARAQPVTHVPVEDLISKRRVRGDFDRHRWICARAPWLLHLVSGTSVSYRLKHALASRGDDGDARVLESSLAAFAPKTIIAVSHRAALWLAVLRRRRRLSAALWGFVSDFALSEGWKHLPWSEVDRLFGPAPASDVPPEVRRRYRRVEMPVAPAFHDLARAPGSPDEVLVTGGGWGLGGLERVTAALVRAEPTLTVHVLCGDNRELCARLRHDFGQHPAVRVYPLVEDVPALLARCASVIAKPGGATIGEARAAGRTMFLVEGLPGVERRNRRHAIRDLGAVPYSLSSFARWRRQCSRSPSERLASVEHAHA
jgi:processive 1,2-diacylglycerol beta-glucosyltransferase